MHSLELTNIDNSRVYRPAMSSLSNDKQRFRPPNIRPIVPIESGRASLSQPLHHMITIKSYPITAYDIMVINTNAVGIILMSIWVYLFYLPLIALTLMLR